MNLNAKSLLKEFPNYEGVYITEDLTLLRAKLLHYVKFHCNNKFTLKDRMLKQESK